MEIKQFIADFAAQFDDTDPEEFKAETKFREIEEWSSLIALSVIAMTDEEYSVVLKGEDIRNAQTVQDLYLIVNSRIQIDKLNG
ncbi:MAG: acyl carrier protein [Prolixibacteraceae bacterium]|nr:acyl carrier protein [Prolixibacteraceae bacterium]